MVSSPLRACREGRLEEAMSVFWGLYHAEAAQDSWQRVLAFFKEHV